MAKQNLSWLDTTLGSHFPMPPVIEEPAMKALLDALTKPLTVGEVMPPPSLEMVELIELLRKCEDQLPTRRIPLPPKG